MDKSLAKAPVTGYYIEYLLSKEIPTAQSTFNVLGQACMDGT
jgi:hypothetical protein